PTPCALGPPADLYGARSFRFARGWLHIPEADTLAKRGGLGAAGHFSDRPILAQDAIARERNARSGQFQPDQTAAWTALPVRRQRVAADEIALLHEHHPREARLEPGRVL